MAGLRVAIACPVARAAGFLHTGTGAIDFSDSNVQPALHSILETSSGSRVLSFSLPLRGAKRSIAARFGAHSEQARTYKMDFSLMRFPCIFTTKSSALW